MGGKIPFWRSCGWFARLLAVVCLLGWLGAVLELCSARVPIRRATTLVGVSKLGKPWPLMSGDGRWLATVSHDPGLDTLSLWETSTGLMLTKFQEPNIDWVGFSDDGSMVAAGSKACRVKVWDTRTSVLLTTVHTAAELQKGAFSPNGKFFAAQEGLGVGVWEIPSGSRVAKLPYEELNFPDSFSRDGQHLVVSLGPGHLLALLDWRTGQIREINKRFPTQPCGFAPDGRTMATDDPMGNVIISDIASDEPIARYRPGVADRVPKYLTFSHNGKMLAVEVYEFSKPYQRLAYSLGIELPDRLQPEMRHSVVLDVETGRRLATLPLTRHPAFSPDDKTLVTYSEDEDAIVLWDLPPQTRMDFRFVLPVLIGTIALTFFCWYLWRNESRKRYMESHAPMS
jgi:WD40 repeat protein